MIKLLLIAFAAVTFTACGGPAKRAENNAERAEMCGGYTDQRTPTEQEKALLRTVTAIQDSVRYTPESVATQVVAGTNYRFVCRETTVRTDAARQVAVTVYQPLPGQGEARITAIEPL